MGEGAAGGQRGAIRVDVGPVRFREYLRLLSAR
jgi:hypothetical protein